MSKINVRSPYYVSITATNLTSCKLELFIYQGLQAAGGASGASNGRSATPTYTLNSFAVDERCTFEISELVRDFFDNEFDGDYSTEIFFVDYKTTNTIQTEIGSATSFTQLKAFYGYGFFEDGVQNQVTDVDTSTTTSSTINNKALLQSNTTIVKLDDAPAVIPVDTSLATRVSYELNGIEVFSKSISSSTNTNAQIEYVTSGVDGADEFENRVLQDSGTFESSPCLEEFEGDFTLFDFDSIYVDSSQGVTKITVKSESECKFTPLKITFVNKYGVLQDIWFLKRSNESLRTREQEFKKNIISSGSYNISKHQNKTLTKNGSETLTLNSGYYPEVYNDVFKEMLLSEDCWIEIESQTLPIKISSSSFAYKTQLNDKIINYTIDVEFAFDTINNVR
tara:strand:- start:281 stop:1465 length:1185 start_codon:yes stop_codon:yes gene_type:complete